MKSGHFPQPLDHLSPLTWAFVMASSLQSSSGVCLGRSEEKGEGRGWQGQNDPLQCGPGSWLRSKVWEGPRLFLFVSQNEVRPEKARKKSEAPGRKELQQAELSGPSAPWAGQLHLLRMGNFQPCLRAFL